MKPELLEEGQKYWAEDRPILTGRVIYESLAEQERPIWAAKQLAFASPLVRDTSEIKKC